MRPIEKRIAAVEARTTRHDDVNVALVLCPPDVDPDVFRARKKAEHGRAPLAMVCFVASNGNGGIKPQAWHRRAGH